MELDNENINEVTIEINEPVVEPIVIEAVYPRGERGFSILSGAGIPSSSLGVNGDSYLNTSNGDTYLKSEGVWSVNGNIKGAPLTYEDLTPEQIEDLQRPALEAAVIAGEATQNAIQATENAEEATQVALDAVADLQSNVNIVFSDLTTTTTYTNLAFANKVNVPFQYKNPTTVVNSFLTFNSSGVATLPITAVTGFVGVIFGATGVLDNYATIALVNSIADYLPVKNMFNPTAVNSERLYNAGNRQLATNGGSRYMVVLPIKVKAGLTYCLSPSIVLAGHSYTGGYLVNKTDTVALSNITFVNPISGGGKIFTVPSGVNYVIFNIIRSGTSGSTLEYPTQQLEEGIVATSYQPYEIEFKLQSEVIPEYVARKEDIDGKVDEDFLFEMISFNKINPLAVNGTKLYYDVTKTLVNNGITRYVCTEYIPVKQGQIYCISPNIVLAGHLYTGGYFVNKTDIVAVSNIVFSMPVIGEGRIFRVPVGANYVVINLVRNATTGSTLEYLNQQLEEGEIASAYQPYELKPFVKESLLQNPSIPIPSGVFNSRAWYLFTEGEDKLTILKDKAPLFFSHYQKRDKDLMVVNTGSSLTERTIEYCTEHVNAKARPPLFHSNNMLSILWDKMRWDSQFYRRYDYSSFYTETGTFSTSGNLPEWDTGIYKETLTRYSATLNASVGFVCPIGAWQFNFIYRTDSVGVTQARVTIAEGNGKMQVFDGATWVEANGYIFSMRESPVSTSSINVPDPATDTWAVGTYQTKGNNTYQKRLKMRCKGGAINSMSSTKNIIISGVTAGRFMYWGVEWSLREFMLTYVNAARGSHNTRVTNTFGLPRFADNEVWSFKPDLMLSELPIHNDGAAGVSVNETKGYWARLSENFVFNPDYALSFHNRSQTLNGFRPEIILFTTSISYNFGGINEDGTLKLGEQLDGSMMTALDKFNQAFEFIATEHPEAGIVNSVQRWINAGFAIYGDLKTATIGSGKDGSTLTFEGSHWNDNGSKIIAKTLTGIFEF